MSSVVACFEMIDLFSLSDLHLSEVVRDHSWHRHGDYSFSSSLRGRDQCLTSHEPPQKLSEAGGVAYWLQGSNGGRTSGLALHSQELRAKGSGSESSSVAKELFFRADRARR
jgi:hypothetical protein